MPQNLAAVILNGGMSRRMGTDKYKIKFRNKTFLERLKESLTQSAVQKVVINGHGGILDKIPNKGPLGGIHTCLNQFEDFSSLLFIPVDMPLVSKECINFLISNINKDATHFQACHFPLAVQNTPEIRKLLHNNIQKNKLGVYKFLQEINTVKLNEHSFDKELLNINSPEDLKRLNH